VTPLRTATGDYVLINRGFISPELRLSVTHRRGPPWVAAHVCGLLRMSEPHGAFLHHNEPSREAWYSRDVRAIALARGLPLSNVAPYFIDADATPNPGGWPVGGLTIIHFDNNHLLYAITWYALALMMAGGIGLAIWRERRSAAA
jgi:surfeit locus 1 family protein